MAGQFELSTNNSSLIKEIKLEKIKRKVSNIEIFCEIKPKLEQKSNMNNSQMKPTNENETFNTYQHKHKKKNKLLNFSKVKLEKLKQSMFLNYHKLFFLLNNVVFFKIFK